MVPGNDVPDVRGGEVSPEVRATVVAPGALLPHRHLADLSGDVFALYFPKLSANLALFSTLKHSFVF